MLFVLHIKSVRVLCEFLSPILFRTNLIRIFYFLYAPCTNSYTIRIHLYKPPVYVLLLFDFAHTLYESRFVHALYESRFVHAMYEFKFAHALYEKAFLAYFYTVSLFLYISSGYSTHQSICVFRRGAAAALFEYHWSMQPQFYSYLYYIKQSFSLCCYYHHDQPS